MPPPIEQPSNTQALGEVASVDPATGAIVWRARAARVAEIDAAVADARSACEAWAADVDARIATVNRFAERLKAHRSELAGLISREVGKPLWESLTEVDAMIGKVPISLDAQQRRHSADVKAGADATTATRYKPHGVVAVFGPFNFPGHLPNGHIVPALLAGNCVIFKPSEKAPGVGQRTVELWRSAGLPPGVMPLVQGARQTGAALVAHPGIDGIFFTGSVAAGRAISRAVADHPQKILALEMGGNNPLIVHDVADLAAAAYLTVQSAFLTSGQRCSCARRLIVPQGPAGDAFIDRLLTLMQTLRVGPFTDSPEPFMGPVVSDQAADEILAAQDDLVRRGGRTLMPLKSIGPRRALLSPGLIDVSGVADLPDVEIFGPLLKVIRTRDFDSAIIEANRTAFGLAAGLLCDRRELYDLFYRRIRAGVVNWNRPTTGASSALPFGGIGLSGNHRPSAYFAADYCSYPVASIEDAALRLPARLTPGVTP